MSLFYCSCESELRGKFAEIETETRDLQVICSQGKAMFLLRKPLWYFISCDVTATLYQTESTWVPERACFIVKTLKTRQVPVNFKLVKIHDGSIVDLNSIPDCDFAFAAAILHFYLFTF